MIFNDEQLERYSRHILLKEIGIEGQERLCRSSVLIIGAGGLGAPAALYLAAAGVGTIGVADSDTVELSNLQRQIIHHTRDIGALKTKSAAEKIAAINPEIHILEHPQKMQAHNICSVIRNYDFIIDGTDTFASKFLINDACILENKPFSHGGILRFTGQTMTVLPKTSACYRCVFHESPPQGAVPTCSQAGVLGAIAGMLGTIQAAETLKWITSAGNLLADRLLSFNAFTMDFRTAKLKRRQSCPVCGDNPVILDLRDEESAVCSLKGRRT